MICILYILHQLHIFWGLEKGGQAPIDLIDKIVQPKKFPPLILNGHWLKDGNATLFNDGEKGNSVYSIFKYFAHTMFVENNWVFTFFFFASNNFFTW